MRNFWKLLGCIWPLVVAYLCQVVISAIGMAVYMTVVTVGAAMDGVESAEKLTDYLLEAMLNADVILVIGGVAIAATLLIGAFWYRKYRPQEALTFRETLNGKLLAAMALLGVALQVLISLCLNAIYPILPNKMVSEYSELIEALIGGNSVLSLVVTVVLAPLAEEFLFRGVTLQKAKQLMPFFAANAFQALMFGVYHGNWIQGTYAFALGMIFGMVAEYFHSIWASILLHAFVNGSAQLLSLLPDALTGSPAGIFLFALIGVVFLLFAKKLFVGARVERPKASGLMEPAENKEFTENSFDEYNV